MPWNEIDVMTEKGKRPSEDLVQHKDIGYS